MVREAIVENQASSWPSGLSRILPYRRRRSDHAADRVFRDVACPMIGVSLLLVALAGVASWRLRELQEASSKLAAEEIKGMLVAQDIYQGFIEIRGRLYSFLLDAERNRAALESAPALGRDIHALLENAKRSIPRPAENRLLAEVDQGFVHFLAELDRIVSPDFKGDLRAELNQLVGASLIADVLRPAERYVAANRTAVEAANLNSLQQSFWIEIGLLLVGVTGAFAGLAAGYGIARGVSQRIVSLDVSIRGAAGRLHGIVGPVPLGGGNLDEMKTAMLEIESKIGALVERLQQTELAALRQEQLASLGQLAAAMAHELRNPLMPMKMLVQSALQRGGDNGLRGRSLAVVHEEIERLEQVIQQFLDFARPAPPAKGSVDLADLVRQAVEFVKPKARQRLMDVDFTSVGNPRIFADPLQIRQAVLNLLLNAIEACSEGDRIDVAIRKAEEVGQALSPSDDVTAWEISIADTGSGIAPEILDRIFEPFVSGRETGNGLGLSLCRRIADAHGGSIVGSNRPERGAIFTLRLPVEAGAEAMS